ncbi:hypothetical protein DPMN_097175 [Dreissena polymorpha]|uniref:Uncharacterized protein n=1 Tax=Dreissena polymorpha TaxID=45954 RepID=A0A9D4L9T2_DREPO|nr:hypothetical protein DPMN_097175 [Dreissena polymorpha]
MNIAMQIYTGTHFETSEQRKEGSESRIARDDKDVIRLIQFLTDHNPFNETHTSEAIRNIETGVLCGPNVNVDSAAMIGSEIINLQRLHIQTF